MGIVIGDMQEEEICPSCGNIMSGYDCDTCGFSNFPTDPTQYETPEGNIVFCTEDEAIKRGYIFLCQGCENNLITWWELEDHGMCIECWHNKYHGSLTE